MTTHGLYYHRLYKTWWSMVNRCTNPEYPDYRDYRGRGITVCDKWLHQPYNFISWAEKNGTTAGLQLDRRKNDAGYNPSNCRFVTPSENAINRRRRVDNKTGSTGVHKTKDGTFIARISAKSISDRRIYLGVFPTLVSAVAARNAYITKHKLPHIKSL